jgi:hypothetical protein
MEGITYEIQRSRSRFIVAMHDPLWPVPWYLKSCRNGRYEWSRSFLWSKEMAPDTAQKHLTELESGADKDWEWYHNQWKEYWETI